MRSIILDVDEWRCSVCGVARPTFPHRGLHPGSWRESHDQHRQLQPKDVTGRSVCSCGFSTRDVPTFHAHMKSNGGKVLSIYETSRLTEVEA